MSPLFALQALNDRTTDLGQSVVVAFVAGLLLSDSGGFPILLIVILFAIRSLYRRLVRPLIAVPSSFLNIQSSVTWSSDKYDITFFHKTRRIQVKKGNIQALICRIFPF